MLEKYENLFPPETYFGNFFYSYLDNYGKYIFET